MAKHSAVHPGFKVEQNSIASREGRSKEAAGAILAAATRKAGHEAREKNPRLNKVKGKEEGMKGKMEDKKTHAMMEKMHGHMAKMHEHMKKMHEHMKKKKDEKKEEHRGRGRPARGGY